MSTTDQPQIEGFDPSDLTTMPLGPFMESLGFAFDRLTPDRLEAHLVAEPKHHQPYGIVHGGVYAAVVETMASVGAAIHAAERGEVVVGVSNTTDFVRAHRQGRLDAVALPVHLGRTQQLWQVDITRAADGRLVARGQVRLQALPRDREIAGQAAAPRQENP